MRRVLFIAVAALLASVQARAQQTSQPASETTSATDGLACFENLRTPEFPKNALQAHVDGSVWTWTQASPQGAVDKIDTQVVSAWGEGPKLLTPPVERAIRSARIKPECAGKTISLVFRYQLHGEPTVDPKVTSRNEAPNIMYIESQPAAPTESASKAPNQTLTRSEGSTGEGYELLRYSRHSSRCGRRDNPQCVPDTSAPIPPGSRRGFLCRKVPPGQWARPLRFALRIQSGQRAGVRSAVGRETGNRKHQKNCACNGGAVH